MTINSNIFKTSTFKLAAIYLLFFALSVGTILAYVFWNTAGLLERQAEETIRAEIQALGDQYRQRGLSGIVDVIGRRMQDETGTLYLMVNAENEFIIGNLAAMPMPRPPDATWVDFPIKIGKGPATITHTAHAFHVDLSGGYQLLVGRDVQELRSFRSLIQNSLYWALGLAVVLGLGGGYLVSRSFLRRIDAINQTSRNIMAGDFSQRMPVKGSGDELDRLAQSLNDMLSQIERLMAGMKEVSSNVAHDLKTPLTRLKARAEAALRTASPEDHRAALQQTIVESDQLLTTFNALLSIARAEAGNSREGLVEVDVSEIIRDVAELYEPIIEDANGTLDCRTSETLMVRADRQLLAQAISNLLDNSMKYGASEQTGTVHVGIFTKSENGNAVIAVADRGVGIPEEDRERVLGRFVRLDQSRNQPGNGLGLSLVSSVVKLLGGTFRLEDAKPGLMAVIELSLVK